MVADRSSNGHSLASECVKSNDGDEEIIKVQSLAPQLCLKTGAGDKVLSEATPAKRSLV